GDEFLNSDPASEFDPPGEHALELPASAEEVVVTRETLEHLQRALSRLNTAYRQIIELRYYRDLNYREMADVLEITPSNAGVRLARALAHLKPLLVELLETPPKASSMRC